MDKGKLKCVVDNIDAIRCSMINFLEEFRETNTP